MSAPLLVVIAGPNGAGKSTLAPLLLRDTFDLNYYVNADTIAAGLSAFRPEDVALEAGRIMLQRLKELAAQRQNFAFETTLSSRTYRPWIHQLQQTGYRFHLVYLYLDSPDLAIQRVAERVRSGGHRVADAIIRRRYEAGLRNFFKLYQPIADSWTIYDNSSPLHPALIAFGRRSLVVTVEQSTLWQRLHDGYDQHLS